jgi:hypothetical protein
VALSITTKTLPQPWKHVGLTMETKGSTQPRIVRVLYVTV